MYRDLASLVPDAAAAELSLGLDTARRSVARGELGPARAQLLQLLQRLGQHHQAGPLLHMQSGGKSLKSLKLMPLPDLC